MPCGSAGSKVSGNLSGRQALRPSQCAPQTNLPWPPGVLENTLAFRPCRLAPPSSSPLISSLTSIAHALPGLPSPHVQLGCQAISLGLWGSRPCRLCWRSIFFIRIVIRYHAHVDQAIHASKTRTPALFKTLCPSCSGPSGAWPTRRLEPIPSGLLVCTWHCGLYHKPR